MLSPEAPQDLNDRFSSISLTPGPLPLPCPSPPSSLLLTFTDQDQLQPPEERILHMQIARSVHHPGPPNSPGEDGGPGPVSSILRNQHYPISDDGRAPHPHNELDPDPNDGPSGRLPHDVGSNAQRNESTSNRNVVPPLISEAPPDMNGQFSSISSTPGHHLLPCLSLPSSSLLTSTDQLPPAERTSPQSYYPVFDGSQASSMPTPATMHENCPTPSMHDFLVSARVNELARSDAGIAGVELDNDHWQDDALAPTTIAHPSMTLSLLACDHLSSPVATVTIDSLPGLVADRPEFPPDNLVSHPGTVYWLFAAACC
ncbi:hypothetical protein M404DRAFT_21509 [Pisolithus tinctorius Marx 270]|uniref:Uncharacterized protein n=1 Tax=Pisolithus tinctorius Marx 270 TaxID=870435 RepID=A0A0C3JN37_PISTI|nr:hypothetical protein M404DRAFT_21509 [Pisolithus tinctorius Marx 270]